LLIRLLISLKKRHFWLSNPPLDFCKERTQINSSIPTERT
jgi:hypothetical protein